MFQQRHSVAEKTRANLASNRWRGMICFRGLLGANPKYTHVALKKGMVDNSKVDLSAKEGTKL
jgi:hypothetical protein